MHAQALSAFSVNRFEEALEIAQRILTEQPQSLEILNIAGISAARLGLVPLAEQFWKRALALRPHDAQFYENLGLLYISVRRFADAELFLRHALAINPAAGPIYVKLGFLFEEAKRHSDAIENYQRGLSLEPGNADVQLRLARLYARTGHIKEAVSSFDALLSAHPMDEGGHFYYATFHFDRGNLKESEKHLRIVLSLNPNYGDAYANLGVVLKVSGRYQEAETIYKKAIELNPQDAQRHGNLGVMYVYMGLFEEAELCYRRAIELKPDYVDVIFNLGYVLLLKNEFEEGLRAYELRYDARMSKPVCGIPNLPYPQWRGEDLRGKSIVIWHEQGFGDIIQFARYAIPLKALGVARITFVCDFPLLALLQTIKAIDAVIPTERAAQMPLYDYWTLVASIPLRLKTRSDTIPAYDQYIFVPYDRDTRWKPKVSQGKFKVGLVWKANAKHKSSEERSLASLKVLRSLWDVKGATFYSLQKNDGEEEGQNPPEDQPLIHLGADIKDFADTAAIVAELDLIICVDTAVVHVAGGLGKPVWVLLPFVADWRWQSNRGDSPWYSSVRLFRQKQAGCWDDPLNNVVNELKKLVGRKKKSTKQ